MEMLLVLIIIALVIFFIVRKQKKKKKYAEEYQARIAQENAQRQKAAEEASKRQAEEEERKRQEAERQKTAAAQARQAALDSGKLSMEDETGRLLHSSFNPTVTAELLPYMEERAEHSWQAAFGLWLMHYIGMGMEADAVEPKNLPDYLQSGLFRKALDMAPENVQKQLFVFSSYLGSGINFMHKKGQDSPELIRMRGLFHAVALSDLIGTATLLYADVSEEALFWAGLFNSFPGLDERNEFSLAVTAYFVAHFDPKVEASLIRDSRNTLMKIRNKEAVPDKADLQLFMMARDATYKSGPHGKLTPMLSMVQGMAHGNAACTYLLADGLTYQDTRQDYYEYCREIGHDLDWGINNIKVFLRGLSERGDPHAGTRLKMLEADTTVCRGELEDAVKN